MNIAAIVFSVSLVVAVCVWRFRKTGNEDSKAASEDIKQARSTREAMPKILRQSAEHLPDGRRLSVAAMRIQTRLNELRTNKNELRHNVETLKGMPEAHLIEVGTSLGKVDRHVAEKFRQVHVLQSAEEKINYSLKRARIAGRVDAEGNVIDSTGLPREYASGVERALEAWREIQEGDSYQNDNVEVELVRETERINGRLGELEGQTNVSSIVQSEGPNIGDRVIGTPREVKDIVEIQPAAGQSPRPRAPGAPSRPQGKGLGGPK